MDGGQVCPWGRYSDSANITISEIRDVRNALGNGRTVIVADDESFVTLEQGTEKQCEASRNGSVIQADAVDASSTGLLARAQKDQAIYLPKTPASQHKKLFTADRMLIAPLYTDWNACIPPKLRRSKGSGSLIMKKLVLGRKALTWAGVGLMIHSRTPAAKILWFIGALYLMQLFDATPVDVVNYAARAVFSLVIDAAGLSEWSSSKKNVDSLLWQFLGLVGLGYLVSAGWKKYE